MKVLDSAILRIGLIVIGLFVGFALLEVAVRIFKPQNLEMLPQGLIELDSTLGYRLARNYHGEHRQVEFSIDVETNSTGLRDREFGEKALDTKRILVLGDSMTFGSGVTATNTWPKVLERLLKNNITEEKWEVINAGIPGSGPEYWEVYFKRNCDRWQPDYVIVGYLDCCDTGRKIRNDYYIKNGRLYITDDREKFRDVIIYPLNDFLRQRSQLYVLLKSKLRGLAAQLFGKSISGEFSFPRSFIKSHQASISSDWDNSLSSLKNLSIYASACSGARTYIAVIPSSYSSTDNLRKQLLIYDIPEHEVDINLPGRILTQFGNQNHLPTINLIPIFSKEAKESMLFYIVDGHFTVNGHLLTGNSIYEWLISNKLLSF